MRIYIHLPVRGTKHAAGYDIEAAEDIVIPVYEKGISSYRIKSLLYG